MTHLVSYVKHCLVKHLLNYVAAPLFALLQVFDSQVLTVFIHLTIYTGAV
jgi:hypothetical protein